MVVTPLVFETLHARAKRRADALNVKLIDRKHNGLVKVYCLPTAPSLPIAPEISARPVRRQLLDEATLLARARESVEER